MISGIDLISRLQQRNGRATFFRIEVELAEFVVGVKALRTLQQSRAQRTLSPMRLVTSRSRRRAWDSLRFTGLEIQSPLGQHLTSSHSGFRSMTASSARIGDAGHHEVRPVVKLDCG